MLYRLADQGLVFSSRDRGARTLTDLRQRLGAQPLESLTVDFADVRSMSYSFVDEFIGELCESALKVGGLPKLVNPSPKIARLVEKSLMRRGLDAESALADALQTA
jgi:anti-anti-sigma regulatory factor